MITPRPLRAQRRSRFNRAPSPALAYLAPWASVVLASLLPGWMLIAPVPLVPPLGFLMLLAWRQLHPGLLPVWAGLPLGLCDDLVSGQPPGSAILLWSAVLLALEAIEWRWPWRNFLVEWLVAGVIIALVIVLGGAIADGTARPNWLLVLPPQIVIAILSYPLIARLVGWCDRLRLTPIRSLH